MAITHVQDAHTNATSGTSLTVALTGVAKGNCLVCSIFTGNGAEVASVTDNLGNLWIRASFVQASGTSDNELWYASGIKAGNVTVTVALSSAASTDFTLVLSEWAGVATVNAMDLEAGNGNISAAPALGANLKGYENGELFIGACKTSVAVTGTPSGFTSITSGRTGASVVYLIDTGTSNHNPTWTLGSSVLWTVTTLVLVPLRATDPPINQLVGNLPLVHCEFSISSNPFVPIWRNAARYLRGFDEALGRNHGLDRFEAADMTMNFDGESGDFNPWNTSSIFYNGGQGNLPMAAVKITAAISGNTYYVAYGYLDEEPPVLTDSMTVQVAIHTFDILEFLQNALLSNNNYAQAVEAITSLVAYWRCGDLVGGYNGQVSSVTADLFDSTPSSFAGYGPFPAKLINGPGGLPLLGAQGHFLYDSSTALDLTNGTNDANGGFTVPNGSPLGSAAEWSIAMWITYTGRQNFSTTGDVTASSATIKNVADTDGISSGWVVTGPGLPINTTIAHVIAVDHVAGTVVLDTNISGLTATGSALNFWPAATLFTTTAGGHEIDIRVGPTVAANGFFGFNTVNVGNVAGGVYQAGGIGVANVLDGNPHFIMIGTDVGSFTILLSYVDGVLDADFGLTFGYADPTGTIIGSNAGPSNAFAGTIQDVAMFAAGILGGPLSATPAALYAIGQWFRLSDTGAGSAVGRLNRVLAVAGFPAGNVSVGQQFLTPVYGETEPLTTTSALDYMQRISQTEPGPIFQGPDGNIYALSRQYVIGQGSAVGLMNPAHAATSQGVFGDTATSTYRPDPTSLKIIRDKLDLWNDVQAQSGRSGTPAPVLQEWGPVQDTRLAQSKTNFGRRTLQGLTQLLWLNDLDALTIAEATALSYASGEILRVELSITAAADSGLNLSQMLGRQIYDRVTFEYQGLTPGSLLQEDMLIEHIEHNVYFGDESTPPTWTTTWVLSAFEINYVSGISNSELVVSPIVPIVFGTFHFGDTAQLTL